jgi:hypothetical protein
MLAFISFSAILHAQQFVDVIDGKTYFYEANNFVDTSKTIYQLDSDYWLKKISIQLPVTTSIEGKPRPKIRNGHIWISNGQKIFKMPTDAPTDHGWLPVLLPDGLEEFVDFEVISGDEILICGASWKLLDENENIPIHDRAMIRNDLHFIYNFATGIVTKTLEEFDIKSFHLEIDAAGTALFILWNMFTTNICRFNSKVLIVGRRSGSITILDVDSGGTKKIQVKEDEIMLADPTYAVHHDSAIAWVSPLAGDEALICFRTLGIPSNRPNERVISYAFMALNLNTGKLKFETNHYRGHEAGPHLTLFEEGGELVSVRDFIKERTGAHETKQVESASETDGDDGESQEVTPAENGG